MNRKRLTLTICLGIFLALLGIGLWRLCSEMQQHSKDQKLIAAIKARKNVKILEALAEGASGEARDTGGPLTFQQALRHLLDPLLHPGATSSDQADYKEQLPALLLLYETAGENAPFDHSLDSSPDLAVVRALLDHGAQINDLDKDGFNPLRCAVGYPNADIVRLLLARGAKVDLAGDLGDTPLMAASNAEITTILLEHGANIEARGMVDQTPLIWATLYHEPDVVRILLEHGAEVSARDATGKTAIDHIRDNPDPKAHLVELILRKYGAN